MTPRATAAPPRTDDVDETDDTEGHHRTRHADETTTTSRVTREPGADEDDDTEGHVRH